MTFLPLQPTPVLKVGRRCPRTLHCRNEFWGWLKLKLIRPSGAVISYQINLDQADVEACRRRRSRGMGSGLAATTVELGSVALGLVMRLRTTGHQDATEH
jgi:hypothetical protein